MGYETSFCPSLWTLSISVARNSFVAQIVNDCPANTYCNCFAYLPTRNIVFRQYFSVNSQYCIYSFLCFPIPYYFSLYIFLCSWCIMQSSAIPLMTSFTSPSHRVKSFVPLTPHLRRANMASIFTSRLPMTQTGAFLRLLLTSIF